MRHPIVVLSLVALAACTRGAVESEAAARLEAAAAAARTGGEAEIPELAVHDIAAPISFLADDLLEGRGVGSRGDLLARKYLATQLEAYGLQPAGLEGSWEQPVPILGITAEVTQRLTVAKGDQSIEFTEVEDFTLSAARPAAETSWRDAPVVFVGHGIRAPEQNWDDFGEFDLTGKVALVMNNDPDWDDELFAGKTRLYYGRWSYKFEEAARRGAVGAIVIHTTPSAGYPFHVIQAGHGKEQFWLPFDDKTPTLEIRSWCSEDAARRMCELGGQDLDALRESAKSRDFRPVELGIAANMSSRNAVRELQSANVLGVLPGTDEKLKDEVVVVTAHFDHLGIGREVRGDGIYNGALDNATGCSALLNLARLFAAQPTRRTLLFLAVTAEESGLLGSKYYARHPTYDPKQLVANFNIDGINIWGRTEDIAMIGHGKNSLTDVATEIGKRRGRVVKPNPQVDLGLFYRSDHFSFARIGVPAAYFKAGIDFYENREGKRRVKRSYTASRYHRPNDQFDERWDLSGAVEDVQLIFECMRHVANDDAAPTWTPGDEFEKLR